jgi:hypothetical protein
MCDGLPSYARSARLHRKPTPINLSCALTMKNLGRVRETESFIFWRTRNHFDHQASESVPQPSHGWTRDFLPPFDHSGINHSNSTGRWRA